MKKTNSGSNPASKPRGLKFETLENRTLLSADPVLMSVCCGNAAPEVEDVVAQTPEDDFILVGPIPLNGFYDFVDKSGGDFHSDANVDEEAQAPSWYRFVPGVNPSAEEQELLEQINRLRTDPQGELDRIFRYYDNETLIARNSLVNDAIKLNSYPKDSIESFLDMWSDISATSPLAFNPSLVAAATSHSSYMKARNDISHRCIGEDPLATRVAKAGFESGLSNGDSVAISENIGGSFRVNGSHSVASYMLAAFAIDWGVPTHEHLDAMINGAYSEVGISIMQTTRSIGPYIVTCDFGTSVEGARTDGAYLLGVIYDDADADHFYDVGEGLGNVTIEIARQDDPDAQTVTLNSWDSGGYQVFLLNGSYNVTVSGDGFATPLTKSVTISDGTNAKLDFRMDEAGAVPPIVDLNGDEEGIDLSVVIPEGAEEPTSVLDPSALTIIDPDSTYLYGAKIYFDARPDGANESLELSVSGTNLTASFSEQMGCITISGTGTIAEYETAISSLKYFNSNGSCDLMSERTVLISVYDGVFWSEEATLSISIEPTNLPNMTVHEMTAYEGDEGAKTATFVVELDSPARLDVTFNFEIQSGGTAVEGYNFVMSKGDPITIAAGETTAIVECYIIGNYEALKPEGLKAVDGGFENPSTYFEIKIVDVENAVLTNEDGLVKGTIYDDDSPIILGTTNEYSLANILSTDNGERRYVFTVSPETSGFYSWKVDTLGVPAGTTIIVRENSLESEAVAESVITASGGRVQWFADPDVEYWITVQSSSDIALVDAKLLEITDEKVVLLDPLLEDSADSLVELMWADDQLEMSVGGLSWGFGSDFWNGSTLKTSLSDVEFMTRLRPHVDNSLVPDDDDSLFMMGDLSMSIVGFDSYVIIGNDNHEELTLLGTEGYDYLYYSNGYGTFLASTGRTYSFSRVNKLMIDGLGGNDYAFIEDSPEKDQLVTYNDSLTMNGGGYKLIAQNFAKSFVVFNKGGEDEYLAEDSGDEVEVALAAGSSITKGTYEIGDGEDATSVAYTRTVMGVNHTKLAPKSTIGSVTLNDKGSYDVAIDATIGGLNAYEQATSRTTSISKVKKLTISGVHPFTADKFILSLPPSYEHTVDRDEVIIVDSSTGWELKVPAWKFTEVSSATLDSLTEDSIAFAFLGEFDAFFEEDFIGPLGANWDQLLSDETVAEIAAAVFVDEHVDENETVVIAGLKDNRSSDKADDAREFAWTEPFDQTDGWSFQSFAKKKGSRFL
ncbi:MAG: carboxypeptidase regulatory-like domain-containing protein [Thermoguttaceae bacterium]|jgi:hypothetical protein